MNDVEIVPLTIAIIIIMSVLYTFFPETMTEVFRKLQQFK